MRDLWFIAAMLGVAFVIIALRVLHDWICFRFFPCKAGDASHDWNYIHHHLRKCKRCPLTQEGEEYTPGLGIVAEGDTWTRWNEVA